MVFKLLLETCSHKESSKDSTREVVGVASAPHPNLHTRKKNAQNVLPTSVAVFCEYACARVFYHEFLFVDLSCLSMYSPIYRYLINSSICVRSTFSYRLITSHAVSDLRGGKAKKKELIRHIVRD